MPTRKTPLPARAKCLICGTGLEALVFDCPECATPHHSACWQWSGGCAVYGCRRAARAPREVDTFAVERVSPIARMQPRVELRTPPAPISRPVEAPADTLWMTALDAMQGVAVVMAVSVLLFLGLSRSSAPRSALAFRASRPAPVVTANPAMVRLSAAERIVDQLVRDDDQWAGTGAEPGPQLRRMMVESRGEALRSGVTRLAARPLPDWVRVRVQALQRLAGELDLRLVLRRP